MSHYLMATEYWRTDQWSVTTHYFLLHPVSSSKLNHPYSYSSFLSPKLYHPCFSFPFSSSFNVTNLCLSVSPPWFNLLLINLWGLLLMMCRWASDAWIECQYPNSFDFQLMEFGWLGFFCDYVWKHFFFPHARYTKSHFSPRHGKQFRVK